MTEYHALYRYVTRHHVEGTANIVIIDEIQMCDNFEKAINSLHALEQYDLYITGSNAFLMSSDLATLFTGRTFQIEVLPFSLSEFARYHELSQPDEALDRYLSEGGMPVPTSTPTRRPDSLTHQTFSTCSFCVISSRSIA